MSRIWRIWLVFAPLASANPVVASAQEARDRIEARAHRGPAAVQGLSLPQISLETGDAKDIAQLLIKVGQTLTLGLSAPLTNGAERTELATLDRLANGFSVKGSYKFADFGFANGDPVDTGAQDAVCRRWGLPQATTCSDGELESHLRRLNASPEAIRRAVLEFDRASFQGRLLWMLSVDAGLSTSEFEHFTENADTSSVRRTSASVGASLKAVYGPGVVSLSVSYENAHKARSLIGQVCTPQATAPLEACKQLPVGAPSKTRSVISRAEWRHIYGTWGIAPTLSWNVNEHVIGLSAPLYVVTDGAGGLTGGIRFAWRSDESGTSLSFFLSKPLAGV